MNRPLRVLSAAATVCLLSFATLTLAQSHAAASGSGAGFTPRRRVCRNRGNEKGEMMARIAPCGILVPSAKQMHFGSASVRPNELPPFPGFLFETPASIACIYHLVEAPPLTDAIQI